VLVAQNQTGQVSFNSPKREFELQKFKRVFFYDLNKFNNTHESHKRCKSHQNKKSHK
jgi:hypothetical protein